MACGQPLEIKLPSELQAQVQAAKATVGGGGSQASQTKPLDKRLVEDKRKADLPRRKGIDRDKTKERAAGLLAKAEAQQRGGKARLSRPPGAKEWAARESQVALWLDNIKPRMSTKAS